MKKIELSVEVQQMIEHRDVPEHEGCNPGTKHPMVMYCETQLSMLVAHRCDCSQEEGYLCPTHAVLDDKAEVIRALQLQNRELQNAVDRANGAMLKHQKHNGALEIAIQEAHRELDSAVKDGNRLADALVKSREEVVPLQDKLKESNRLNSELRIHLRAMCDEIGDRVRFAEARRLALELLSKSEKR